MVRSNPFCMTAVAQDKGLLDNYTHHGSALVSSVEVLQITLCLDRLEHVQEGCVVCVQQHMAYTQHNICDSR